MTIHTPICDLLGVEHPVLLAGMGGVSYAEVCAAVSAAGGFGSLGMAGLPPKFIADQMARVKDLTDKPFGGYKQSGNGREWGDHAFADFLEVKAIIGWGEAAAAE